jgi:dTDP-4-dehydrorhamnose reductase
MDIADASSVTKALQTYEPWAVINAAGYVRVDDAERDRARCRRENTIGPALLAAACARAETRLMTFSSDLVFGGERGRPYGESAEVSPQNVYGQSKAKAEREVLKALPNALVIRTSAFFGPWDEHNFVTVALRALASGKRFPAANDSVVSPTYVPDLVHAALDLLIDGESGIWHLANSGETTWFDLARRAAELSGLDASLIDARPMESFDLPARRPSYSVLCSERGTLMQPLDDALSTYMSQCETRLSQYSFRQNRQ